MFICRTLALRVENVITSLVSPDQTAFIKGKWSFRQHVTTIQQIPYNTISNAKHLPSLNYFGLGLYFINWLRPLYNTENLFSTRHFTLFKDPLTSTIRKTEIQVFLPICTTTKSDYMLMISCHTTVILTHPSTSLLFVHNLDKNKVY